MSEAVPTPQTRPSLLVRIRDARDDRAWEAFITAYGPLLYRYGRKRGLQEADAADLTQEVLSEVARSIRGFHYDPGRGRFRDWLGTVASRTLTRLLAKQQRAGAVAENSGAAKILREIPDDGGDTEWTAHFNAEVLRLALEHIRPHFEAVTWRAFERVWLENRSAAETAAELGLPIERVYVAKSRVLKQLEEEVLLLAEDVPQFVPLD